MTYSDNHHYTDEKNPKNLTWATIHYNKVRGFIELISVIVQLQN